MIHKRGKKNEILGKVAQLKDNLDVLQNKAKERTVKTQSIEYDLETLVKKITRGVIRLDPDYQRRHRWTKSVSSRLIESLILNILVPRIYLSYDIDVDTNEEGSRYSVIDGQQRLTAIYNFFEGKFPLENLEILDTLEGCYYKDLPPFLIRRLEERTIKCLRIDSTVDPQVKFDIFERLNSGSVRLESHELRNAVLRGPFNNLCKELSKEASFRIMLQIHSDDPENNEKVQKMEDVELVLRFFSLIDDNYKKYKKTKGTQFKDFLSDNLVRFNLMPQLNYEKYTNIFKKTMQCIHENFGKEAFAKYRFKGSGFKRQSKFNNAVYDALSVAIASEIDLDDPQITEKMKTSYIDLFKEQNFYESVDSSNLDSTKLVYRIEAVRSIFKS